MAPLFTLRLSRSGGAKVFRTALAALTGAALVAGAAEHDASAYVVKRTSRGELVHWEQAQITYSLDPSVNANVVGGSEATAAAMSSWSGTVGAPDLAAVPADETSPTKPGFDQKNGIFFMKTGYAPAGRALAITVLTYDNATGRILDADIVFNGTYSFAVLTESGQVPTVAHATTTHPSATDGISHEADAPAQVTDTIYDLHHVIAHEVGHSVGMNDEMSRNDALMYRYTAPNDATMRAPASDDIAGLAELYSTKLESRGNGCGSATVAPKKPSSTASHVGMFATLGLLLFLVLRSRSDRRARVGFVLAAAAATVTLMPTLSKGRGEARATEIAPGHARAKVLAADTTIEDGLFKTTYRLATVACRASACPKLGHGAAWGGTIGDLRQEVGGYHAPATGEAVDVSFDKLPNAIAPLSSPLAGRPQDGGDEMVRVLTAAD